MIYYKQLKTIQNDFNEEFNDILSGFDGENVVFSDEATKNIFKTLQFKLDEYKKYFVK